MRMNKPACMCDPPLLSRRRRMSSSNHSNYIIRILPLPPLLLAEAAGSSRISLSPMCMAAMAHRAEPRVTMCTSNLETALLINQTFEKNCFAQRSCVLFFAICHLAHCSNFNRHANSIFPFDSKKNSVFRSFPS